MDYVTCMKEEDTVVRLTWWSSGLCYMHEGGGHSCETLIGLVDYVTCMKEEDTAVRLTRWCSGIPFYQLCHCMW